MGAPPDPKLPRRSPFPPFESNTVRIEEERLRQLIEQQLANRAEKDGTVELSSEERKRLPLDAITAYGLGLEHPASFITLPDEETRPGPKWVIELQFGRGYPPVGVFAVGDVVLGVSRPGESQPDFDLTSYGADEKGVSRRHAVLRPSRNRLYLIDLQSTNGTRVNAMPVGAGVAMEVRNGDAISLGALTINIKVLATPADVEKVMREAD